MPRMLRPTIWTQQPPQPVEIDWTNPITRGLVVAWNGATPDVNLCDNKAGTFTDRTGIGRENGRHGVAKSFTGGVQAGKYVFVTPAEKEAVTFFWIGRQSQDGVSLNRVISDYNGASNGRYDIYLETSGGNPPLFQVFATTANGIYRPTSAGSWLSSQQNTFCITYDSTVEGVGGAVPVFYSNGVANAISTVVAASGALVTAGTVTAVGGRNDVGTRQLQGALTIALRFDRALSEIEVKSLSANPWQIFKPIASRNYLSIGSATTSYTISPTGSVSFSGTSAQIHIKVFSVGGSILFSGNAPLSQVTPTTYTITPSGTVVFSGSAVMSKTSVLYATGQIVFGGSHTLMKTKILSAGGTLTLSGTANLIVPGEVVESSRLPLTGVGT